MSENCITREEVQEILFGDKNSKGVWDLAKEAYDLAEKANRKATATTQALIGTYDSPGIITRIVDIEKWKANVVRVLWALSTTVTTEIGVVLLAIITGKLVL